MPGKLNESARFRAAVGEVRVHGTLRQQPLLPPSRNPVTPTGRGSMRGSFASLKNAIPLKFESDLERKVFALLEFAPSVTRYSQQPPRMPLRIDGRTRLYTPDVAVQWRNGAIWLIEVKPSDLAAQDSWQAKFEAAQVAAAELGYRFVVVTERQVEQPGMRDVHRWLEMRRRHRTEHLGDPRPLAGVDPMLAAVPSEMRAGLDRLLSARTRVRVDAAVCAMGGGAVGASNLESLLAVRYVVVPLSEQVTDSTLVQAFTEADDELLFA
jgi:hypothetical protein